MIKFEVHSSDAWIMFCILLFVSYFLRIWFSNLPFLEFATYLVAGFGAFLTKRHYKGKLESEANGMDACREIRNGKSKPD